MARGESMAIKDLIVYQVSDFSKIEDDVKRLEAQYIRRVEKKYKARDALAREALSKIGCIID